MKQFDVFESPADARGLALYLVVLTSHHLDLEAVLVAPLVRRQTPVPNAELVVHFNGEAYVLSLITMAAIPPRYLRRRAGSLGDQEDDIRRGLDRLFTGF